MKNGQKSGQTRDQQKQYAFKLFMKQTPDGKHLYSQRQITQKVNKKWSTKHGRTTIQRWSVLVDENGNTWKCLFLKALSTKSPLRIVPKKQNGDGGKNKVAKGEIPGPSMELEIEAAGAAGLEFLAEAKRKVAETSYILDFVVKIINNELARLLRERTNAGQELTLDDIKMLFTRKGIRFVYDYWRYNLHIVNERLKLQSGEGGDLDGLDEALEYLESFTK